MRPRNSIRTLVAALAFATFAITSSTAFADEPKVPQSTAEHEALAKQYREQAAQYKQVADEHRAMAAAYAKANPDFKGGVKNAFNEKMQKHCKALAADADKLASDAAKAADFHMLRGKELQGK